MVWSQHLIGAVVLAGMTVGATNARADYIDFQSIGGTSGIASFTGRIEFTPNGFSGLADLAITLTNTSPADNGGYLTGFAFNILDSDNNPLSLDFLEETNDAFQQLSPVAGQPFGTFEIGTSVGSPFNGGGSPTGGLAVGQSRTFLFELNPGSAELDGTLNLSALTFFSAPSTDPQGGGEQVFIARFKGFEDGGSDKSIGGEIVGVPLPGVAWAGLVLMGGLGITRKLRK